MPTATKSCRPRVRSDLNKTTVGQQLLSVTGQLASLGHQPPSVKRQPPLGNPPRSRSGAGGAPAHSSFHEPPPYCFTDVSEKGGVAAHTCAPFSVGLVMNTRPFTPTLAAASSIACTEDKAAP